MTRRVKSLRPGPWLLVSLVCVLTVVIALPAVTSASGLPSNALSAVAPGFSTPFPGLSGITTGPDGALWITMGGADRIARLTMDGGLTEFPLAMFRSPREIVSSTASTRPA
jgi:hypothetical protein